ncbi:MAG: hemolysin family protein [Candidatus Kapabacteria bacterium]|nr:hemolysin family protein [Candidatus Kapabacteria bacterium]
MIFDIFITLFFVVLNGFFVAAEFALVKVRASQIELRAKKGQRLAILAQDLIANLDSYLSATQLGITLASLGLGWVGEGVVSNIIINLMHSIGLNIDQKTAHSISLPIAFLTITFLHIVFGELAPKSIAIQKSEKVTIFLSMPLRIFYLIFKPFIWFLNGFANRIIKFLGFEPISEEDNLHSADELRYLIKESSESGLIDDAEQELIENVFEFSETPIRQIMVPRNRIVAIDITMDKNEIIEQIIEEGFSRMPVYEGSIDNIIGIIYSKDIISLMKYGNLFVIQDLIRQPIIVNEDDKINNVLSQLKKHKNHFAIVKDEFDGIAGIVTMEDIIEEVFGEIQDEYDEEQDMVQQTNEFEFVVQAAAQITEINELLIIKIPESDDYDTIGGYVLNLSGKIPEAGEVIKLKNYKCEILKRNERKLEELKLTYIEDN